MKPMNAKQIRMAKCMAPLWWLLGHLFRRPGEVIDPKSILIFDFHLIGDIVLLTPLLRSVRKGYPRARIVLVAGPWARDILHGEPWVDEIIPFSAPWVKYGQGWRGVWNCLGLVRTLRRRSWDTGIEVRGDVRQILMLAAAGARRRISYDMTGGGDLLSDIVPLPHANQRHFAAGYHQRLCEYLGIWEDEEYLPSLMLTKTEMALAEKIPAFVGIHFGASLLLRRPPASLIAAFADELVKVLDDPLVIYQLRESPDTAPLLADHLVSNYGIHAEIWEGNLREFIVHLSRCKQFYCLDSGPGHIAAALGIPVTVIYGPSLAEVTQPLGPNVRVVPGKAVVCRPCDQKNCTARQYQECFLPADRWI